MTNYNVFFPVPEGEAAAPREGQEGTGNTGTYQGSLIRVKGDGRVEAIDAQGKTTMHTNVLNAKTWIDAAGEVAPPEPVDATLTSIDPVSAPLDLPAVTLHAYGTGFVDGDASIAFSGADQATTFVDDTHLSTLLDPAVIGVEGQFPVTVRQGGAETDPVMFDILPAGGAG